MCQVAGVDDKNQNHEGEGASSRGDKRISWWRRPKEVWTEDEKLLACGTAVVSRLRAAVRSELSYSCTAGQKKLTGRNMNIGLGVFSAWKSTLRCLPGFLDPSPLVRHPYTRSPFLTTVQDQETVAAPRMSRAGSITLTKTSSQQYSSRTLCAHLPRGTETGVWIPRSRKQLSTIVNLLFSSGLDILPAQT